MTPPKDQAPGLVARLARYGKPSLEPSIIADYSEELAQQAHDRIKQLEAENAELRGKLEKAQAAVAMAWFCATQKPPHLDTIITVCRDTIHGTEQANIRSPVQSEMAKMVDPR